MRTVLLSRRRRTVPRRGVPVALGVVAAMLLAGCAPGDGEPDPVSAPSVSSGTATPDAEREAAELEAAEQEAAEEAAEQEAAEQEAAEKKAAEKKAAKEAAEQEAAEQEAAEKKAAEEEAAREAAEQEAAEKKAAEERAKMLEYGDSGERVTALQSRLQELGYFVQEADGSFGPATQQAVWALQKAAGLYRDGVIGPQTQAALEDGVRPSAQSSSGKAVEIDIDRQLLMTVEDGVVTRIINASSGNGETFEAQGRSYTASTPRGSYAVYMERDRLHESTLELGAMWRPKYFNGGFAVHGSPSIPPVPASHGCVRVSNSAMNWLWDDWGMPHGTPVIVY
ncbi:L,D-transpeptidase family protein [Isoptericola cucumis]|uniref:L,D-TPase catalytic domain-containing protein n=1 Tax=Isoptericola cucumis TaxID=1776856 RepID=A0ABQ2BAM8_9MICO|nr:L,D-transpeptidase family protein [Isoptericola cucumis]GGI10228.1 hypothetical protein GCM10007368_30200 [Isoptericola cucumis]